jgi:heat shock protein HslJ
VKSRSLLGILVVFVIVVIVAVVIIVQTGAAQKTPAQGSAVTDPQMLMIPRWFLRGLSVDGKKFDVPADQQNTTLQFVPDGSINGTGGCNSFSGSFQAAQDGKMHFEKVNSTLMACENGMDQESAYFSAMAKVEQFKIQEGKLILTSADGQTALIFARPPK